MKYPDKPGLVHTSLNLALRMEAENPEFKDTGNSVSKRKG